MKFLRKILRIGRAGKSAFFSQPVWKKIQWKQPWVSYEVSFLSKLWWLPWFPAQNNFSILFCTQLQQPIQDFFGLLVSSWRESTVSVVFQDLKFKTTSVFSWPTRHRRLEKSSHTTGNFVLHVPWIKPACMNHLLNRNIDHASKVVDFKYGIVASSSTHY